jgi:hypothetical protein
MSINHLVRVNLRIRIWDGFSDFLLRSDPDRSGTSAAFQQRRCDQVEFYLNSVPADGAIIEANEREESHKSLHLNHEHFSLFGEVEFVLNEHDIPDRPEVGVPDRADGQLSRSIHKYRLHLLAWMSL